SSSFQTLFSFVSLFLFFLLLPPPPPSTLFPYTTLFRSSQAPAFPADTDLLMVMLGTNDLLQGRTPSETAQRMLRFLAGLTVEHRSEEHTSELQSRFDLVCRLLLEKKNTNE